MTQPRPLDQVARDVDETIAHLEQLQSELDSAQQTIEERIALLVGRGMPEEVAVVQELGGRATSREIASVIHSPPLTRGQVVSVGRRMRGLETRGYLRRQGDEWVVAEVAS